MKAATWLRRAAAFCITAMPAQALAGQQDSSAIGPASIAGPARSGWSFAMTTYGWLPWLSGDVAVKGRQFSVDMAPPDLLESLDWSSLPVWMSYAEARNGRLSFFNDIVYSKLASSAEFAKSKQGPPATRTLAGSIEADYEQATLEFGAAYEVWSGAQTSGFTAIDVLGGARYWHQDASISGDLNASVDVGDLIASGGRVFAKSGSVDWVDPFIGARLRHELAPGQALVLRGDIGGFGAGSDFSWQAIATYNFQLCLSNGLAIDSYIGYRALAVDYAQGSGTSRYEYDVLQQGPVMGMSMRF